MATTVDWGSVKSVSVLGADGKTLGTDPEIWCGGHKQWPVDTPVAVPCQTGQTGTVSSGTALFNVGYGAEGVAIIAGLTASDTSTHYASFKLKDGYCWADGSTDNPRLIAYSLTKTSVSFSVGSGASSTAYTVSGFSPTGEYTWDDAIDSGAVVGFAYGDYYVTTSEGLAVFNPTGEQTFYWDAIASGNYTVGKKTQSVSAYMRFADGLFSVGVVSGTYVGQLSYAWKFSDGTAIGTASGPSWYADLNCFPDMKTGTIFVTVTAAGTDEYEEATGTCAIVVSCKESSRAAASAGASKRRLVSIGGNTYCAWVMPFATWSDPYTRYAVRRSTSASESAWGSDTYWRQYFIPYDGGISYAWTTMKYRKYSNGSFAYAGYTTGAWYMFSRYGGFNIWVTSDDSHYYNMAAVTKNASDPAS